MRGMLVLLYAVVPRKPCLGTMREHDRLQIPSNLFRHWEKYESRSQKALVAECI